jgi:hypothetical protein
MKNKKIKMRSLSGTAGTRLVLPACHDFRLAYMAALVRKTTSYLHFVLPPSSPTRPLFLYPPIFSNLTSFQFVAHTHHTMNTRLTTRNENNNRNECHRNNRNSIVATAQDDTTENFIWPFFKTRQHTSHGQGPDAGASDAVRDANTAISSVSGLGGTVCATQVKQQGRGGAKAVDLYFEPIGQILAEPVSNDECE